MTVPHDWQSAPAGLLTLDPGGDVADANEVALRWLGAGAVGRHITDLLSAGGRIYWETHLAPLLHVEGALDEVAVSLRGADGPVPVLLSARRVDGGTHVALSSARERTRYERELVAARTAAERSEAQVRALQAVSSALSDAGDVAQVAEALITACRRKLGADTVDLWLVEDGLWHAHGDVDAVDPPSLATMSHQPHEDGRATVVPLVGPAGVGGALRLTLPTDLLDAGADPVSPEVLASVGRQAGLALERARLHQHSAHVAHQLQQSLLAGAPPVDSRFTSASSYHPGVAALDVGGDFFDVFVSAPGVLTAVVGDVVGRGLAAASAMGQLRSAVRALAGPGVGPAQLLTALDRFVDRVDAAAMATIAYVELHLETGQVCYACAGHPPPLVSTAQGETSFVWEGRSAPLGSFVQPAPRVQAELQLSPGSRLLLYTDGLVESRTLSLDEGLLALSHAVADTSDLPVAAAVADMTATVLRGSDGSDDVCALAVEWVGPTFRGRVQADLSTLAAVRHGLEDWLVQQAVAAPRELVLAASEAVANAAEHGLAGDPGRAVDVAARLMGDDVVVTVHDDGQWRVPRQTLERGRGLRIADALVDALTVDRADGTTVVLRRSRDRGAA